MKTKIPFLERRYLSLTICVGFIFFYLLFTEVYNRYSSTLSLYQSLREKRSTILDPVFLKHKKKTLTEERDSLSSKILKERSAYPQNEIGVIQCVADNARKNQIIIQSINPGDQRVEGQFEEFDFNVSVRGRFDQLGLLINRLEKETFDITKMDIVSDPIGTGNLSMNVQAKAYLYHGLH